MVVIESTPITGLPGAFGHRYKITFQEGDSFRGIARHLSIDPEDLYRANMEKLGDREGPLVGQELTYASVRRCGGVILAL